MGIDLETTAERLQIINENLSFIRSTLPSTPNQLADNQLKLRAVKEALLVTIQASIDIGSHLIAVKNLRRPAGYEEIFEILQEEKIIPSEIATPLKDMARFRNRLVHVYHRITVEEIFEVSQKSLNLFLQFANSIKKSFSKEE